MIWNWFKRKKKPAKIVVDNGQGWMFEIPEDKKAEFEADPPRVNAPMFVCPSWATLVPTEQQKHELTLRHYELYCQAICDMVEDYFEPPNLMAWTDERPGGKWEVFVRRKGSDEQFHPADWGGEATGYKG